jgi:hypothetical protein
MKPPVGIDLLAILLFETKDKLNWREVALRWSSSARIRGYKLLFRGNNNL